jgi:nitrate/nitrite transport system substrate-binding protein
VSFHRFVTPSGLTPFFIPKQGCHKELQLLVTVIGVTALEKTQLTFGFIPLTDCAPLVVAKEGGFFAQQGLEVTLSREPSWANIRDKVLFGELDGAQMLAGMPLATTLGLNGIAKPTITAFNLDLNGNAITVSHALYQRLLAADPVAMSTHPVSARALKKVIDTDKAAGKDCMTFAMVFPVSTHNYALRYWMAAAGIHPDKDVRLVVVPPPKMVMQLQAGNIHGYCVGEPWNSQAVKLGIGHVLITNYEIWNNMPEKVLGVNQEWADSYPHTHQAVLRALLEACRWLDQPENRLIAAQWLAQPHYVGASLDVVKMSMLGTFQYHPDQEPQKFPDFNVFHRYAANFPWRSQAAWFLSQMLRWGDIEAAIAIRAVAQQVYRPDLYRQAAAALGIASPQLDEKTEGIHAMPWTLTEATSSIFMGTDQFLDGKSYDPQHLMDYLADFTIHCRSVALTDLKKADTN